MKSYLTFINEGRVVNFDNPNNGNFIVLMGGPGSGKCLKNGTRIIMFDGTLKNIEDVNIGDLLMGPDSKPRMVLSTSHGTGVLYDIKQSRGLDYTVNENHILSLTKSIRAIKDNRYNNEPNIKNIPI